jgi:hypothetical protein
MKLNIKPKAEQTIQRNLRMPVSLNNQMNDTSKLADELGVDYHATLISTIEQFNTEFNARLREMKGKGQSPTSAGIESIPEPVSQHAKQAPESSTKSTAGNGADPESA